MHIHDELNLDAGLGGARWEVPILSGPLGGILVFREQTPSGSFTIAWNGRVTGC